MNRFTFKTWCKLPFVVIIRLPFALAWVSSDKLSDLFRLLSDKSYDIMSKLPEVRYSDEWLKAMDEQATKQRLATLSELQKTSQKD